MILMRRAWNCGEFYTDSLKLSKVQLVQFGDQSPDECHSYVTFLSDHDFFRETSEIPAIIVGLKKSIQTLPDWSYGVCQESPCFRCGCYTGSNGIYLSTFSFKKAGYCNQ